MTRRRNFLGRAYVEGGQLEDAIQCVEPVLESLDLESVLLFSGVYAELGQLEGRARTLDIACRLQEAVGDSAAEHELLKTLFEVQKKLQWDQAAAQSALRLLAQDPQQSQLLEFAEAYFRKHADAEALSKVLRYKAEGSALSPEEQAALLWESIELSSEDMSTVIARAVTLDPHHEGAAKEFERVLEKREDWNALAEHLNTWSERVTPENRSRCLRKLAWVHAERRSDHVAASEALSALLKLEDSDDVRALLIDSLTQSGQIQEALSLIQNRLSAQPELRTSEQVLLHAAEALCSVGKFDEAYRLCAAKLNDEHTESLVAYMLEVAKRGANFEHIKATLQYRAESEQGKERAMTMLELSAHTKERLSDIDEAMRYATEALREAPNEAEVLRHLEQIFSDRLRQLVELLRNVARQEERDEIRADLFERIALLMWKKADKPSAAQEAFAEVLKVRTSEAAENFWREHPERKERSSFQEDSSEEESLEALAKLASSEMKKPSLSSSDEALVEVSSSELFAEKLDASNVALQQASDESADDVPDPDDVELISDEVELIKASPAESEVTEVEISSDEVELLD
jgi:tetratricopeptide (TPR) repeat protein